MTKTVIPKVTLSVEAQPWPKDHVARIASIRVGKNKPVSRKKLETGVVAK